MTLSKIIVLEKKKQPVINQISLIHEIEKVKKLISAYLWPD